MQGYPLKNLLLIVLALGLLAVPLLRIGQSLQPAPAIASNVQKPVPQRSVTLTLRFVHPPLELAMQVRDRAILLRGQGLSRQAEVTLPADQQELEGHLKIRWSADAGETFAELRAAPDGQEEQQQNLWSEAATVDETVRFHWKEKP